MIPTLITIFLHFHPDSPHFFIPKPIPCIPLIFIPILLIHILIPRIPNPIPLIPLIPFIKSCNRHFPNNVKKILLL